MWIPTLPGLVNFTKIFNHAAEATFWAAGNVCAHCGVLRADHNVCGTFVRGPAEGYRKGYCEAREGYRERHRAFCATCGMPDDYHKACATFVPGPSCTGDRFGARIIMCEICNFLEREHMDALAE